VKIYINPARHQQLMIFLDSKFPIPEQNSTLRQRLQDLGLRPKIADGSRVHTLTDRQVDVLQRILTCDSFTTTKIELYFLIYNLYNEQARTIQINKEYEDDLAKLEFFHLTLTLGDRITLAIPGPQVEHTAVIEIDDHEETTQAAHSATSNYNLRGKRKSEASSSSQSNDQKKVRGDARNATIIQTLTDAVQQLQENEKTLQSNHDFLYSSIQRLEAAHTMLQADYNDLQSRLSLLEAKEQQNQNIVSVATAPDVFYNRSATPLFFNSPQINPSSPLLLPVSPREFFLADDSEQASTSSPSGFTL
jgi:hypothetical protein